MADIDEPLFPFHLELQHFDDLGSSMNDNVEGGANRNDTVDDSRMRKIGVVKKQKDIEDEDNTTENQRDEFKKESQYANDQDRLQKRKTGVVNEETFILELEDDIPENIREDIERGIHRMDSIVREHGMDVAIEELYTYPYIVDVDDDDDDDDDDDGGDGTSQDENEEVEKRGGFLVNNRGKVLKREMAIVDEELPLVLDHIDNIPGIVKNKVEGCFVSNESKLQKRSKSVGALKNELFLLLDKLRCRHDVLRRDKGEKDILRNRKVGVKEDHYPVLAQLGSSDSISSSVKDEIEEAAYFANAKYCSQSRRMALVWQQSF